MNLATKTNAYDAAFLLLTIRVDSTGKERPVIEGIGIYSSSSVTRHCDVHDYCIARGRGTDYESGILDLRRSIHACPQAWLWMLPLLDESTRDQLGLMLPLPRSPSRKAKLPTRKSP
jgi:hypothetical protein